MKPKLLTRKARPAVLVGVFLFIALGAFFRLARSGSTLIHIDESFTLQRIAGRSETELPDRLEGRLVRVDEVNALLKSKAGSSLAESVRLMAVEAPHNPPLYYGLARILAELSGEPLLSARLLSAFADLFGLIAAAWLCFELFGSATASLLAVVVLAVSPLQLIYSNEARAYSFWSSLLLLANATLLYALRKKTFGSWALYSATLVTGLYSHLFFTFTLLAHTAFVLTSPTRRKLLRPYAVSAGSAALLFAPWAVAVLVAQPLIHRKMEWASKAVALPQWIQIWVDYLGRLFFNPGHPFFELGNPLTPFGYFSIFAMAAVSISGWVVFIKRADRRAVDLLLAVGVWCTLPLLLGDVLGSGSYATIRRYVLPLLQATQLAVVWSIAHSLQARAFRMRAAAAGILAALLAAGLWSGAQSLIHVDWDKDRNVARFWMPVSRLFDEVEKPVLITEYPPWAHVHLLPLITFNVKNPRLMIWLQRPGQFEPVRPEAGSVYFVMGPSKNMRQALEKDFILREVHVYPAVWRLDARPSQ